jgi:hypothetical protein
MVSTAPSQPTPPTNTAITVSVSPSSAQTLDQNQTLGMTASVANDGSNAGVQWSVNWPWRDNQQHIVCGDVCGAKDGFRSGFGHGDGYLGCQFDEDGFRATVNPSPSVTATTVPPATLGAAYSAIVTAAGGTSPFAWAVASGSTLPSGLSVHELS